MKKRITIAEAEQMMFDTLNEMDLGDKIYEFAQDLYQGHIQYIEDNYEVDESNLDRDARWYDDIYEEFYQAVYDAMVKFLTARV